MSDMENLGLAERMRSAMRKKGITAKELADKTGLSRGSISFILNGKTKDLMFQNIFSISQALDCDMLWLMKGEDTLAVQAFADGANTPDGVVAIKSYHIEASAGPGIEPAYQEEVNSRPSWYHLDFFKQMGVKSQWCRRLKVSGDSMSPLIRDGDWILVNCEPGQQIIDGDIYAFYQKGQGLRVKRVYKPFKGGLILHSDNDKYDDETYSDGEELNFILIGRVLERSGSVR